MSITTNYSVAYIFTKHTDLLQWFDAHHSSVTDRLRQYYAKPRKVQLILLARFDGTKHYYKIKCPINPLPVKGEFEASSLGCIERFLSKEGWSLEQKLPINFLK